MKKVRMAMLVATMVLGTATVARAQNPQQQGGRPNQMAMLMNGITLTADQQTKVDSIWKANEPMREQMRSQMKPGETPDSAMRAHMMAMRDQQTKAYRAILTPDQAKTFDKNVAEMRERMRSMSEPSGPAAKK